ncbi:MAG: biopolymer transporter ExbD [Bacteroidota bacterium]
MGLKKKRKVSAQFNMSSLTDIIFLLLIFFMLTSSLIQPNAINMKLPTTSRTKAPSKKKLDKVEIRKGGRYYFNSKRTSLEDLERQLSRKARSGSYNLGISNTSDATGGDVAPVLDMTLRLKINPVFLTTI